MKLETKFAAVAMAFSVALAGTAAFAAPVGHSIYAPGTPIAEEEAGGPFVTFGTKWGAPAFGTPGGTVTYSFMATGTSCAGECPSGAFTAFADFMPVGWEAVVAAAFGAWEAVANIQFVEVADNGDPFNAFGAVGDIRIGGHFFDGPGGVLAHGYFPPPNGTSAAGDIHFDTGDTWKIGFAGPGFDLYNVMAHEIGHAIGLEHTPVPDSLMNPFYTEAFSGPQADDIAGAQFIYGPNIVMPAVPVPAALPLLASGLMAFGALRRFRRAA
jgi:hypothetical protein